MTALTPAADTSAVPVPGQRLEWHLDRRFDLQPLLEAAEAASPAGGVDAIAAELAARVGATEVGFLLADISGDTLVRMARVQADGSVLSDLDAPDTVPIAGTVAGRALRTQRAQLGEVPAGVQVHLPVTERGEAVGVLELVLASAPDTAMLRYLSAAAHTLAFVIIADRRYTDLYEWGARNTPLTLAAEIQRQLLPSSYACEASQFTLAGWLVPANQAGGDTFDYAVDREHLHLSLTDAMGHGVDAAQLATLAVGSLRNSRRRGASLAAQARRVNEDLCANANDDQFVTGQLLRLDLATGAGGVVNAGHMNPLLVRDGCVRELELAVDLVFGVQRDAQYRVQKLQLEPGDRLVLVTDGMFERSAASADVARLLADLRELHPREAVQMLTTAVMRATAGRMLDDATVLVVDWHGGPAQTRRSSAGADQEQASS